MIYLTLFWTFFKIGLFTFGGGYAMIPLIQSEVLAHKWMALEDLINFIAVSESTPGPFAINISTYIGAEMGGFFGSVCATLGVVLPSFVIILIVAKIYDKFKESKLVSGAMSARRSFPWESTCSSATESALTFSEPCRFMFPSCCSSECCS